MFLFSGRAKYAHEHTSALPFLHTNHNPSFLAEQGLMPHSCHTMNKCTLIIPWNYSIRHNCYIVMCVFLVVSW